MIETKQLILLGGGGHCKSVIEAAESAGYTILGILDKPENVGKEVLHHPIVGTDENIADYVDKALFVVSVGQIKSPTIRMSLYYKIKAAGGRFATIVASTAHVSTYCSIGEGSVIMHQAVVNASARVGAACIINTFANIEHDAFIGDFCHISTGAMINGDCKVGKGSFIGSQAVLVNGISIAEQCIIGAGAMVRKSIEEKGTYSGNPATLLTTK